MKRFAYSKLLEWKNDTRRKPLILQGARQVGKTYLVKEFAKNEYKNNVYLNFEQDADFGDRRYDDRRKESGEGFTYVSTVGWICRREQCRRKEDPFDVNF